MQFGKDSHQIQDINEIKRGAIILKYASDFEGDLISVLQTLHKGYPTDIRGQVDLLKMLSKGGVKGLNISHALIYAGGGRVIEAVSKGVQRNSLFEGNNQKYNYEVFNCTDDDLANNALEIALLAWAGKGAYNRWVYKEAPKSLPILRDVIGSAETVVKFVKDIASFNNPFRGYETRMKEFYEKLKKGQSVDFFCSELVAFSYHIACAKIKKPRIIGSNSDETSPLELLSHIMFNDKFSYIGNINPQKTSIKSSAKRSTLQKGDCLQIDEYLESPNGAYQLYYQEDGNLVINECATRTLKWATNKELGKGKGWLTFMQDDGNFVVYNDRSGKAAWASGKCGNEYKNCRLEFDNEGSIVLKKPNGDVYWKMNCSGKILIR